MPPRGVLHGELITGHGGVLCNLDIGSASD
jgi:hypothetical protein